MFRLKADWRWWRKWTRSPERIRCCILKGIPGVSVIISRSLPLSGSVTKQLLFNRGKDNQKQKKKKRKDNMKKELLKSLASFGMMSGYQRSRQMFNTDIPRLCGTHARNLFNQAAHMMRVVRSIPEDGGRMKVPPVPRFCGFSSDSNFDSGTRHGTRSNPVGGEKKLKFRNFKLWNFSTLQEYPCSVSEDRQ